MKALIADHSRMDAAIIHRVLERVGEFEDIKHVDDGAQVLRTASEGDFDLVLLDWNMPNRSGIDILRGIRAMGLKASVIMVTGEKDRTHVLQAFESGANDYAVKPIEQPLLREKIRKVICKSPSPPDTTPPPKALVADDSGVIRKILSSALTNHCGFTEVVQATDGAEAVAMAQKSRFGLILLDWNMPNMLGIDALKVIRETDAETPIIMVTSEKERGRVVEAFDAGANNFIIKPFEVDTLTAKIKQVLEVHG